MRKLESVAILLTALLVSPSHADSPIQDASSTNGLAYDLSGEGPLIVLIHGTNLDRRMWQNEVAWLQDDATVLAYDLRGHGQSAFPEDMYANHEDLISLLDEIGMETATLVGLSAGAQVALDVALEAPERVERLVLVSPSLSGYIPKEMPPYLDELMTALRTRDFKQANELLLASSIMEVPEECTDLVRTMVQDNERLWMIPYTVMKQSATPAIKRLAEVHPQTLILTGENDVTAVKEQAEILGQELASAQHDTVPDGGHLLNLTSPEEFRHALEGFLE